MRDIDAFIRKAETMLAQQHRRQQRMDASRVYCLSYMPIETEDTEELTDEEQDALAERIDALIRLQPDVARVLAQAEEESPCCQSQVFLWLPDPEDEAS